MTRSLLIAGASARAAAQSAVRSGWSVTALDLFADRDLAATCEAVRVESYPWGLIAAAAAAPP
ncbi:MAG: hypothetical protein KY476_05570, partial [Planctomycetes bacterium]|nr:hypothetical protein [Planctomycetota bacterium]